MLCLTRPSRDAIFPLLTTGRLETWPLCARAHDGPASLVSRRHLYSHLHLYRPAVDHKRRLINYQCLNEHYTNGTKYCLPEKQSIACIRVKLIEM